MPDTEPVRFTMQVGYRGDWTRGLSAAQRSAAKAHLRAVLADTFPESLRGTWEDAPLRGTDAGVVAGHVSTATLRTHADALLSDVNAWHRQQAESDAGSEAPAPFRCGSGGAETATGDPDDEEGDGEDGDKECYLVRDRWYSSRTFPLMRGTQPFQVAVPVTESAETRRAPMRLRLVWECRLAGGSARSVRQ